ncbi:cryptochrome/photolyase family protein [Sphingomonas sp. SRS2]|uniref:cryptochrome/photolyase family protein n=1 Tax=Sphingomonas sp. SRS2 TaxID=133190 RepID=UPI0006184536|nr:deoxyribodipyrimidine photo-lyase [Sphingomonas sp. SRS2]KKC27638.1 deoxyribodipyrimidine photolyase [Sphingomonas sp. SRS2]
MTAPSIVWFRQDLRLADQAAVAAATADGPWVGVYVLDDEAPGHWAIGAAQRWWLHHSLDALGDALAGKGGRLVLRRGDSLTEIKRVAGAVGASRVHAVRHYEPWWQTAEQAMAGDLDLRLYDGGRLAPPGGVLTGAHGRYRIFTPYWRALKGQMPPGRPSAMPEAIAAPHARIDGDTLDDWNLRPSRPDWATGFDIWTPGEQGARDALGDFLPVIGNYGHDRDRPSVVGTSRLSPHLHFGEISPATLWYRASREARAGAEPWLRQLGWRDFAANVVDILPDYGDANGRDSFDHFKWRTGAAADRDFRAWTRGRTGYPIVDAGMRELWTTGFMHNRVRMIAASFLIKHLLIDWRRGERWFWDTLVDADYGSNAVNWQWVAGAGIDSNPFGRIMAPLVQSPKFDAGGYIRDWIPELAAIEGDAIHDPHEAGLSPSDYPLPVIGHREARERALAASRH